MTFPEYMDTDTKDLIDRMLTVYPPDRIGTGEIEKYQQYKSIRDHPFFKDFDFENYKNAAVPLP